jgi:hypothetical protein
MTMPRLFLGLPMKVKTFTGTHRAAVDKQVNDWLAQTNVPSARPTLAPFAARRKIMSEIEG